MGQINHIFTSPKADDPDPTLIRPSDWNSGHQYTLQDAVSLSGNTSGALANVSSGTLYLAGGNNITLSQAGNSVTISGANVGGAQTGISGVQVSDATYTSGTVTFRNSNGISFGSSGAGGITASYTVPAVPPETPFGLSAGTQSVSTGTLVFSNSNNVTFGMSGSSRVTASASFPAFGISAGTQSVSTGTLVFSDSNGIVFGMSGSSRVTASYTVPTVTNSSWSVSDAATSGTVARLAFTNLNGITLSLSTGAAGSHTIVGSYTVPTVTAGSDTLGVSNLGNTAGTSGVVSGDSVRYLFAGGNNITLSQSINGVSGTVTISAFNQTTQSAIKAFGASNTGNTAGNTGVSTGIDWVIAGTNNVTVSQSTAVGGPNTLWLSAPNAGGAGQFSGGASNLGNTAGSTGVTGTRLVFVGTNMISLSQSTDANGGTLSFNATQSNQSAIKGLGVSNTGNTAGNTGLSTGIDWVIAGSGEITASQSTAGGGPNTIWLAGPGTSSLSGTGGFQVSTNGSTVSLGDPAMMECNPFPGMGMISGSTLGQNSIYFVPFDLYQPVSAYRANFFFSISTQISALNSTGSAGYTFSAALYTRGSGASTERITTVWSGSWFMQLSNSSNSNISVTHPQGISNSTAVSTAGSNQNNVNASTYLISSVQGFRCVPMPISSTLTPGRYWMALANSATANSSGSFNLAPGGVAMTTLASLRPFRPFGTSSVATDQSFFLPNYPGLGTYSATSGAFPGSVALTTDAIRGVAVQPLPLFNFSGLTTGTNVL